MGCTVLVAEECREGRRKGCGKACRKWHCVEAWSGMGSGVGYGITGIMGEGGKVGGKRKGEPVRDGVGKIDCKSRCGLICAGG